MAEEEEIAVEMDGAVSGWRMNGRAGGRSAGYRISSRGGRDGGMSNDLFMHQISFIAILFWLTFVEILRETIRCPCRQRHAAAAHPAVLPATNSR
jgi:hypothetical protein